MFTLRQKLAQHKMRFEDQMEELHDENEQRAYIIPHSDWNIDDLSLIFDYIHVGYLVESGDNPHGYIINKDWEWVGDEDQMLENIYIK